MADDFRYDVFLSHSSKDKEIVREIAERLRADGLRVWFDSWEIKPGDSIPKKIDDGLKAARVLVLCLSAQAAGSEWAQLESYTFRFRDPLNRQRRFIPLRLDASPIEDAMAQFSYINWLAEEREQEYAKLLSACLPDVRPVVLAEQAASGWCTQETQGSFIDKSMRDDFTDKIKETLAKRVGMLCSNPACRKMTSGPRTDPTKALNIGVAAHITAASLKGPRHDSSLSELDRSSIENGIWLCQNCAKLVDNDELRYTVAILRDWKQQAENDALLCIETSTTSLTIDHNSPKPATLESKSVGAPAQVVITLDPSPFHPFGAINLGAKSYIPRVCDGEFKKAAESHTFIWLQGDFQFGKTSLLRRHESWLAGDWFAVYTDMVICDRSTDVRFRRDFFAEINEATKPWQHEATIRAQFDWRVLRGLSAQRKIVFILDEIGACKDKQIKELIEGFHSLADWAPGRIKLVASFREGPIPLLTSCGVNNPRHTNAWKIVRLEAFTIEEVSQLIDFFPNSLSQLLHNRIERLRSITCFKPQGVQYLLNKLWEVFRSPQGNYEVTQPFIDAWLDSEEVQ